MDSFYIGYRDPLFGIIALFLLVFIISFANYWWGVYKDKNLTLEKMKKRVSKNLSKNFK